MSRLRKCLTGEAAKYVHSMMVSPDNVQEIMKSLQLRFGQSEHIIEAMIEKARNVSSCNQGGVEKLIEFGAAVKNFTATVKTLNKPEHLSNPALQRELESKLTDRMKMKWIKWTTKDPTRSRNLEHFSNWLGEQTDVACAICPPTFKEDKPEVQKNRSQISSTRGNQPWKSQNIPTAATLHVSGERKEHKCIFCDKHFKSADCRKAREMSLEEKTKIINEKKCCLKCLRPGHWAKNCQSYVSCTWCLKQHPTCMCPSLPTMDKKKGIACDNIETKEDNPIFTSSTQVQVVNSHYAGLTKVLLNTLMVKVRGKSGWIRVRALLDQGSQRSYVLKSVAAELGLVPISQEGMIHSVFSGYQTVVQNHNKYRIQVYDVRGQAGHIMDVWDQEKICGDIPRLSPGPWIDALKQEGIELNDVGLDCPEIGILIGADAFRNLLLGRVAELSNGLTAVKTLIGWSIMGEPNVRDSNVAMKVTGMVISSASLEQLWSLESIEIRDPVEVQAKEVNARLTKDHFLQTVTRTESGRYAVNLPWIDGQPKIPDNRRIAEKRLLNCTRKLNSQGQFENYDRVFSSWEKEKIIEEVKTEDESDAAVHYIPHRAVFKPESLTTPLRPVFDASCKSDRTPSLNECLEKGPNLLELIPSIILRFREKKIGIIADTRKAFKMVEVKKEDRDFLRLLWWDDSTQKKIKVYRHRRVVFGVNSGPFLYAAVLEFHLSNVQYICL